MNYYISKDSTKIPVSQLAELLHKTYWAENRPVEAMEQSIRHSLCYGAYDPEDGKLIGFARVITDYATTYYLCDVVVEEAHRGKGIGKALLARLAAIARERGCGRMEWSCLDWNQPSIDVYRALGAVPMDGWTVYRLTGESLDKLAKEGQ